MVLSTNFDSTFLNNPHSRLFSLSSLLSLIMRSTNISRIVVEKIKMTLLHQIFFFGEDKNYRKNFSIFKTEVIYFLLSPLHS
jgi:hypothetical protein